GQVLTGIIAAETASSVTLRRGEKAEDVILRSQIDEIQATAKSLMPEGLEMQMTKQEVADVIAYLQAVAVPKGGVFSMPTRSERLAGGFMAGVGGGPPLPLPPRGASSGRASPPRSPPPGRSPAPA